MKKIKYDPDHKGSFDQEWGIHKKCREWWYSTSILFDEDGNLKSLYQSRSVVKAMRIYERQDVSAGSEMLASETAVMKMK